MEYLACALQSSSITTISLCNVHSVKQSSHCQKFCWWISWSYFNYSVPALSSWGGRIQQTHPSPAHISPSPLEHFAWLHFSPFSLVTVFLLESAPEKKSGWEKRGRCYDALPGVFSEAKVCCHLSCLIPYSNVVLPVLCKLANQPFAAEC